MRMEWNWEGIDTFMAQIAVMAHRSERISKLTKLYWLNMYTFLYVSHTFIAQ